MRNCEKFQADCASHSSSVKCLLRSHNTSLAILYFQENFIVMTEQIGQRYCIRLCQKLGDTQIETLRKIQQVFGDVALSPTQIEEWFKRFKNGRESVESEPRSGRPCTSRNEEVKDEVLNDRIVTVREIANLFPSCWRRNRRSFGKKFARTRWIARTMIQNLWRPSSLVMRPEFMVTTQKQNSNLPNGSIRNHHDPKKHGRFGARWKWCWPVFWFSWHCASRIRTRRPNNQQRVLPGGFTSTSCSCAKKAVRHVESKKF